MIDRKTDILTRLSRKYFFYPIDKPLLFVYNDTNDRIENLLRKEHFTMDEKEFETEYYTLTDEEGNELNFEVIASAEIEGTVYYAMIPVDDQPEEEDVYEYVILKAEKDEDGEDMLVTIDDDEEFDSVADYFDDLLSNEADYDVNVDEK